MQDGSKMACQPRFFLLSQVLLKLQGSLCLAWSPHRLAMGSMRKRDGEIRPFFPPLCRPAKRDNEGAQ